MSATGRAESYAELSGKLSSGVSFGGTLNTPSNEFSGNMSIPDAITGKSAYEIAVMNGFNGTEAEWLASLKAVITEEDIKKIADEVTKNMSKQASSAKIGNVNIFANKWVGADSPFSQVVDIEGVTENSQVDLTPSVEQLAIFHDKDLAFVTENYGGVVTVYAIGQKPENDYTIQVTITEVLE
mgnify:CR=1 FL=1